jgi:hypothetical protein
VHHLTVFRAKGPFPSFTHETQEEREKRKTYQVKHKKPNAETGKLIQRAITKYFNMFLVGIVQRTNATFLILF